MGNVLRRETGFEIDKEIDGAEAPEDMIERISNMKASARANIKLSDEDNLNDLNLNNNNQHLFDNESGLNDKNNNNIINNNFEDSNNEDDNEEERLRQLRKQQEEEERRKKLEEEERRRREILENERMKQMNEQLENQNQNSESSENDENINTNNNNIFNEIKNMENKIEEEDDEDPNEKLRGRNKINNRGSKRIFLDEYKDRKTKNMIREENNLKEDILNLYI